jgi:hypothetical protein
VLQSRVLVKDSREIDDETAAAIQSVSQGAQGGIAHQNARQARRA